MINWVNVLRKDQPEHFIFTDRKGRQIGESEITGVEGDQNVTPQILIEEDDDLNEQDIVDKELAAQPTEDEDHLKAYLNQELTIESLFEDISDQQQKTSSKNFKRIQSWIKHPRSKQLLKNRTKPQEYADTLGKRYNSRKSMFHPCQERHIEK